MSYSITQIVRGNISGAKRCPHCDTYFGKPELWKNMLALWWEKKYSLYCPHCHWRSGTAITRHGAVVKWNEDEERFKNWQTLKAVKL